jgi:hypothetical protein
MEFLEFLSGLLENEVMDERPEHAYWPKMNEDAVYVLLEYVDALLGLMKSLDSLSELMANDNFLPCQLRGQLTEQ